MPQLNKKQFTEAKKKASKLGVKIKLSNRKNKKLDVYKNNKYFGSIGDTRYEDYLIHKDDKRRKNFRNRFRRYINDPSSKAYYSIHILW